MKLQLATGSLNSGQSLETGETAWLKGNKIHLPTPLKLQYEDIVYAVSHS